MSWHINYPAQEGAGCDLKIFTQSISCLNAVWRDRGQNTIVLQAADVAFDPKARHRTGRVSASQLCLALLAAPELFLYKTDLTLPWVSAACCPVPRRLGSAGRVGLTRTPSPRAGTISRLCLLMGGRSRSGEADMPLASGESKWNAKSLEMPQKWGILTEVFVLLI